MSYIRNKPLNLATLLVVTFAGFLVGCDDPYSRRRIQRRWDHFTVTANEIGQREADGVRRVDEDLRTLDKWWKSDCERFNRKAPTVGDYVW